VRISDAAPLVLGSSSPRRRELLEQAGIPHVVREPCVDEGLRRDEAPPSYLQRVVRAKLDAVRSASSVDESRVVLVADTIVIARDGAVLGKPADAEEALAMIERLSGATHRVSTAFILAGAGPRRLPEHFQTVTTSVTFRVLRRGEVQAYIATGEGRDKAGGYGIQGRAAAFVERIEGSYSNVVGLPLCELVAALWDLEWMGDR
jgi:septum formation protein